MIMGILTNPAAPPVLEENKEFCYTLESIDLDVWRECYDPCKEKGGSERDCENECLLVNFGDEDPEEKFKAWQADYMKCFEKIDIERVATAIATAEYNKMNADL